MKWTTPVKIPVPSLNLQHGDSLLAMGSCFADRMAVQLAQHMVDVVSNPLGIAYNPASLALHVRYLLGEVKLDAHRWLQVDGTWRHPDFHSGLGHVERDKAEAGVLSAIKAAKEQLDTASACIITLGTAMTWSDHEGRIVTNCHKQPEGTYVRTMRSIDDCVDDLTTIVQGLRVLNSGLPIIFTLSPVRHIRDGLLTNARSKARLLEAIHTVCETTSTMDYYPAYEILLDELRDYRYYADDMVHPSDRAVDYIFEHFIDHYYQDVDPSAWNLCHKLYKIMQHQSREDLHWSAKRRVKVHEICDQLYRQHGIYVDVEQVML